MKLEQKQNNL